MSGAAPMPCAWPVTDDMKNPAHYPLAKTQACYAGDGVACVLADSATAARDALEAINVQYEPLEAVIDLEDALSDRVVIHDDLGTNTSYTWNLLVEDHEGAVDEAFAAAAHTVSERYIQQRLIPMAMEPRAVLAMPQPFGGEMTLYSATQIPHILKVMVGVDARHPRAPDAGRRTRRSAARSDRSSTCTPRNCCAWRSLASTASRCAGTRTAPRTRWRRSTAAARSRRSSSPPMPTASSPRSASACSPTWAPTCSS